MSYLVLARRYRPKNFSEMVGQAHVVQALTSALSTQRLHHAYLFTGTRGVGKTTVSRVLAKSLNCVGLNGQGDITATPCGQCQACVDIDGGRFIDYTELDAASNRGVDEMAQLLEQAVYKPVMGRFKVFMIDEVHMLSTTAFNAMLKTLEEPPPYLKFVLATTDPQKVPATVLSRCLQFNLRPIAAPTVFEHLSQVLQAENIPAQPAALRLLAHAARGSMRDALSLTDQAIAFSAGQLTEDSVRQMLGSVDRSHVFDLIAALANSDGKTVVQICEQLRVQGSSAASTLEEMTLVLQRMAVLQVVSSAAELDVDEDADPQAADISRLARALPADETQLLYSMCLQGQTELGLAPDEYAALTMVLLRLLAFKPCITGARLESVPLPKQEKNEEKTEEKTSVELINIESVAPKVGANSAPLVVNAIPQITPVSAASSGDQQALDDVWYECVQRMVAAGTINALVRELAMHSQLRSRDGGVWSLGVQRESLNQPATIEKLQLALQGVLQGHEQAHEKFTSLVVQLGSVSNTPAERLQAMLAQQQQHAEQLVAQDPLVQELIGQWDGKIVPGSIKSEPASSTGVAG